MNDGVNDDLSANPLGALRVNGDIRADDDGGFGVWKLLVDACSCRAILYALLLLA